MQNLFYYGLIIISVVIAVWDFLYYKIPNKLLLIMFALYVAFASYMYFQGDIVLTWHAVIITLGCFAIGLILFYFNLLGAGDAKYLCLAALWMDYINIIGFISITAIAGGAIAIFFLTFEMYWQKLRVVILNRIDKQTEVYMPSKMVPYGMAISIGIIYVLISEKLYIS